MKTLACFVLALIVSALLGEYFIAQASDLTQTVSGGGVTAKVTYLNPKTDDEPRLQVVLDTHSVALDAYDLKTMSILRDGTGKEYVPTSVENKGSGHHRSATLTFPKISANSENVELVIKDLAGVKERRFRWDLSDSSHSELR